MAYRPATVGLVVFAVGGVGDGIWHTVFGIETSLDALLSPIHLVLLVGLLLGATAPLLAAWRDPALPRGPVGRWPLLVAVLSLTAATGIVAFFFLYANGFNGWRQTITYVPGAVVGHHPAAGVGAVGGVPVGAGSAAGAGPVV